jgi:hypothetical protein
MIYEIVLCELCGRRTLLYPSERRLLEDHPRLTITCDLCVADFRRDALFAERKRLHRGGIAQPVR